MEGNKNIDALMMPVLDAIKRHVKDKGAITDIYNRAYEAVMESLDAKDAHRDEIIKQQGEVSVIFQEQLSRRDEIIKRLKEDGERLARAETGIYFDRDGHEYIYCLHNNSCGGHDYQKGVEFIHAPTCPITLHRALMKELEG